MRSFYHHPHITHQHVEDESALYPLLALYDTLNDDDDDIRDLGALTVSKLLQRSLVPLAARVELIKHIKRTYGSSALFSWATVCRMTGNDLQATETGLPLLEPVGPQFTKALRDNDSLFVEEEQNLFIDEVREAGLWSNAFEEIDLHSCPDTDIDAVWGQPFAALVTWVNEGLSTMTGLLDREDGPLGWTSRAAVFAICMRVLLSAKAIVQCNKGTPTSVEGTDAVVPVAGHIHSALERFMILGREKNIHGSLLFEV